MNWLFIGQWTKNRRSLIIIMALLAGILFSFAVRSLVNSMTSSFDEFVGEESQQTDESSTGGLQDGEVPEAILTALKEDPESMFEILSYMLGTDVAQYLDSQQFELNPEQAFRGMMDALSGESLNFSDEWRSQYDSSPAARYNQQTTSAQLDSLAETLNENMEWINSELEKLGNDADELLKRVDSSESENQRMKAELDAQIEEYQKRYEQSRERTESRSEEYRTSPVQQRSESIALQRSEPVQTPVDTRSVKQSPQPSQQTIASVAPSSVEITENHQSDDVGLPSLGGEPDVESDTAEQENSQLAQYVSSAASSAQSLLDSEAYTDGEISDVMAHRAVQSGLSYGANQTEAILDQFGNARLEVGLDEQFTLDTYSFDYLLPYSRSQVGTSFLQLGYRDFAERDLINIGLGYRRIRPDLMWGVNAFYDHDLTLGHRRASVGAEVMLDMVHGYTNAYFPLSDWQAINDPSLQLQSQAAAGVDAGVRVYSYRYPGFSASAEYFMWFNDYVDMTGSFEGNSSAESFYTMESSPSGVDLSVEYRPVPLLSASVSQAFGIEQGGDLRIGLELIYDLDRRLADQLKPEGMRSAFLLEGMRESFVERESNIILAYRERPEIEAENGISISMDVDTPVTESETITLSPYISTTAEVVSYEWSGATDELNLSATNIPNPQLTAPPWNAAEDSTNEYSLTLTVTDILGRTNRSETTVVVYGDEEFDPKVTFYSDSDQSTGTEVEEYVVSVGGVPVRLFWSVVSERDGVDDISEQDVTVSWGDPGEVLIHGPEFGLYPAVNTAKEEGVYDVTLNVVVDSTGEDTSVTVPIIVGEGTGKVLNTGGSRAIEYALNGQYPLGVTGNDGALSYASNNEQVGTVNGEGVVSIIAPGDLPIRVHDEGTNNLSPETENLVLTIEPAGTGLAWDGQENIVNGTLTKTVADQGFTTGTVFNDSDPENNGTISYKSSNPDIAEINPTSGAVTLKGVVGNAIISATQTGSTNQYYRETTIRYRLSVVPVDGAAALKWDNNMADGADVDLPFGTEFPPITASAGEMTADIYYYISAGNSVASVDSRTGQVTQLSLGTATVSAVMPPTPQSSGATISYNLELTKNNNNNSFEFAYARNGKYAREFTDGSFDGSVTVDTSTSDGKITYESSEVEFATIDQSSGLVTLIKPGQTTITAVQEDGANFGPGQTSYLLTVLQGKSDLAWVDTPPVVVLPFGTTGAIYTAESTNNPNGKISYDSSKPDVAKVDPETGELTLVSLGTTEIIATQEAAGDYHKTTVKYLLNVQNNNVSDLSWDALQNPTVQSLQVPHDSENYFLTASSSDGSDGAITYKVHVGNDVVTIDNNTGELTINSMGDAYVTATQAASTGFNETTIGLKLVIGKGDQPGLRWSSGKSDNYSETYPYGIVEESDLAVVDEDVIGKIEYKSQQPNVADVDPATGALMLRDLGTATITANLVRSPNYLPKSISYNVTVEQAVVVAGQDLIWSDNVRNNGKVTTGFEEPLQIAALTPTIEGAVIEYDTDAHEVATVDPNGTVTTLGLGSTIVTATLPDTDQYLGATIQYQLVVEDGVPNMEWQAPVAEGRVLANYDEIVRTEATSNNTLVPVSYSIDDSRIATVDGGTGDVTPLRVGTATVTARQEAVSPYKAHEISYQLVVRRVEDVLTWKNPDITDGGQLIFNYGDDGLTLDSAIDEVGVGIVYSSSDSSIADIDSDGQVTFFKTGTVTITADRKASGQYKPASSSYELVVERGHGETLGILNDLTDVYLGQTIVPQYTSNTGNVIVNVETKDTLAIDSEGNWLIKGHGDVRVTLTEDGGELFHDQESPESFTARQPYIVFYRHDTDVEYTKTISSQYTEGGAWEGDFKDNYYNNYRAVGIGLGTRVEIYDDENFSTAQDWSETDFLCNMEQTPTMQIDNTNVSNPCFIQVLHRVDGLGGQVSSYKFILPDFVNQ